MYIVKYGVHCVTSQEGPAHQLPNEQQAAALHCRLEGCSCSVTSLQGTKLTQWLIQSPHPLLLCASDVGDALPPALTEGLLLLGQKLPEGVRAALANFHFTAMPMQLHAVSDAEG